MITGFRGVYTALVTPFMEIGNVDYHALERMIEFQIQNGIDGLVPCGTTGESPTLSHEEHDRVIAKTIQYAKGRVPVIAGTGSNATSEAIRLSQHAEDAGADAILLVNPYYNKPTQKGLYLHFKAIAASVHLPCVLYNIKGRTGVNLSTEILNRLEEECPNIIAVKEASGDLGQMEAVIKTKKEGFSVLSGDDNLTLDLIKLGGDGVVSVASNLFPAEMVRMTHSALDGDWAEAEKLDSWFSHFFKACFFETNPIPIKTAMAHRGMCLPSFRLPLCEMESEEKRRELLETVDAMFNDKMEGRI